MCIHIYMGYSDGASDKEPACQFKICEKHRFYPWVGKNPLEKEMATHSSNLACRTPWAEKPGRLQSIGSQRVGQE